MSMQKEGKHTVKVYEICNSIECDLELAEEIRCLYAK